MKNPVVSGPVQTIEHLPGKKPLTAALLLAALFFIASCRKEKDVMAEGVNPDETMARESVAASAMPLPTGNTYYLSPSGNDNNAGTISSPWFSLYRAWQTLQPGDLLYLRGGTYVYTSQQQGYMTGKSGTASNMIFVFNYPGEKPILTKGNGYTNNQYHWRGGCYLDGDYIYFKGISFYRFNYNDAVHTWMGLFVNDGNFNIIEQCNFIANGNGCKIEGNSKGNLVKNCDSWYNYDTLTGGGNADGFGANYITAYDPANPNVFRGCRSWWNGDDGFDGWQGGQGNDLTLWDSCWSWNNGYRFGTFTPAGNGEGFKAGGGGASQSGSFRRIYQNCMAFYNKHDGFNQNNLSAKVKVLNCIAYKNAVTGINFSENNQAHEWRNNVSFDNIGCQAYVSGESVVSNNSYGLGASSNAICGPGAGLAWTSNVSAADFLSTDTTGVSGSRQADGSLPNINFMKLNTSSDLIDAGMNVGLPFAGNAPDRGACETGVVSNPGNQAPVANAGADKSVTLPATNVSLTGSGNDPDGSITGYSWTRVSGPNTPTLSGASTTTLSVTGLIAGTYVFRLTVTDNAGATGYDDVNVVVSVATPSNQAPTANAGADKSISLPTSLVTLTGSGTDPDGSIASYSWIRVSGPNVPVLSGNTTTVLTATGLIAGTYVFRLTVTDNGGLTGTDEVNVTVTAAAAGPANAVNVFQAIYDVGYRYYLVQDFGTLPDNASNPTLSTLRLYENGVELKPPHSGHSDIANYGAGRFSHWSDGTTTYIYFSASDNSNPKTNGRVYTYTIGTTNPPPAGNTPYGGTARAIPGTIQAEDFDNGGQNIAYYDRTIGNAGLKYRLTEAADIGNSSKESSYYLGWTQANEWLKYTVNITASRNYTLELRVAAGAAGKSVRIEIDGTTIATVSIPNTGGGQKWTTVTVPNVYLSGGTKVMRLFNVTGGQNINYIRFL